jgi:hypothetical protein
MGSAPIHARFRPTARLEARRFTAGALPARAPRIIADERSGSWADSLSDRRRSRAGAYVYFNDDVCVALRVTRMTLRRDLEETI